MGFFDRYLSPPEPAPQRPLRPQPDWARPEDVLPAIVPLELMLVRTAEVAVWLPVLYVYPAGFGFRVSLRLRNDDAGLSYPLFSRTGDADIFRLAVRSSDGSNLALLMEGGGGGGGSYDTSYWVHPLPPPGPLTFVCVWPAGGLPESRAEVPAQAIIDAVPRSRRLWQSVDEVTS